MMSARFFRSAPERYRTVFYFIPFLTMHFLTYVLIPESGDIKGLVARGLAPFDDSLTVPSYKEHLHPEKIQVMALKFNMHPSDHDALATLMPAWSGHPGGVDEDGLFAWKDHNPDGHFDWYQIGGRFDGAIVGKPTEEEPHDAAPIASNVIEARALALATDLKERLPAAVVAPGGNWLERSTLIIEGWARFHTETKDDDAWLGEVKAVLEIYPYTRVVGVDLHQ